MARQIARVTSGQAPVSAYEAEERNVDSATGALLGALHRLYHVVSQQNRDLGEVNAHLEEKVAERTQELSRLLQRMEETQRQLLQSEKMAAIGQLAAGVAHEINNPIGFVHSNLISLKKYVQQLLSVIDAYERNSPASGPQKEVLDKVREAADLDFVREDLPALLRESEDGLGRVTKIVRDLKDFSHVDEAEYQLTDLNAGMDSTLNVVWNELKYKAEVIRDYGDIAPVECMAAQVNQVFMNLLVNAAQAIPERGTITVRSGQDGGHVWMEVQDSGVGMSPEVQARIFEPFYTTKPVGKGTGLGLSLSYDIIVKRHGGRIDVTSDQGKGSTFRVTLPIKPVASAEGRKAR
jgi:signal transduction histidine kinase